MRTKPYTIIANWKMYYSYAQLRAWCQENKNDLISILQKNLFILCPSYESLDAISKEFLHTSINIGAQNCSAHANGAYTGQVMAQSLHELGIGYCIIGHSEMRKEFHETNEHLLHKMNQLIAHAIIPIFCLGETKEEFNQKATVHTIEKQLEPVIEILKTHQKPVTCFIAYEPIWAIGTGIVADNDHIATSLDVIKNCLDPYKNNHTFMLLYGGTVTSETVPTLKKVKTIEGFLIGKASTNFQELKKIVSLVQEP